MGRRLSARLRRKVVPLLQVEPVERADRCHYADHTGRHRIQLELLTSAISDPDLDVALSTSDTSPAIRREYLFANALHTYRMDSVTLSELHGRLRVT